LNPQQLKALRMATLTAAFNLDGGLWQLHDVLMERHDFYPGFVQPLAQATEYLLKLIVALDRFQSTGTLPPRVEFRRFNHDLMRLHGRVVEIRQGWVPIERRNDRSWWADFYVPAPPLIQRLLALLSAYGEGGRYFYMDALLSSAVQEDPGKMYLDFVRAIGTESSDALLMGQGDDVLLEYVVERPAQYLKVRTAVVFEDLLPFLAALCRMAVTLRGDGDEGPLGRYIRPRTWSRPPRWTQWTGRPPR
jgi:hypothetical protein